MTRTNEHMKNSLNRVIAAIDKWWVEITDSKKGEFYRYDLRGSSNLTFKDYIEWRYKSGAFEKDYISLFISIDSPWNKQMGYLVPSPGDAISINLSLRKMENGVYTVYDPFCQFQNNNYGVFIDAETGFDKNSMIWDFITLNDINHLIDRICQIIDNNREDQPVEGTASNDEITDKEEIMNTQNESVTIGDGLEKLSPVDVLNVLINELNSLRVFWPKFFNASIDANPDENGDEVVFTITSALEGFTIYIQNKGFYVCQLQYRWCGGANANLLNINKLNKDGVLLKAYKGICMRQDTPKLSYWDQDELKAASSSYPYLWDFMSRLYGAIYEAMRDAWIKNQEIEKDLKYTKYNGIISRPIFDPQFLEPGALLQIYVKEDLGDGLFKKGIHYNCFVIEQIDHNTGLKVMCIDHRDGKRKAVEYVFSVKDVTTGKIEINRVK